MRHSIPIPFAPNAYFAGEVREAEGWERELTLRIADVECSACSRRAEISLRQLAGVASASVGFLQGLARVRYDARRTSAEAITAGLHRAGYRLLEPAAASVAQKTHLPRRGVRLGLCLVAFANLILLGQLAEESNDPAIGLVRLGLAALVLLSAGVSLVQRARAPEGRAALGRDVLSFSAASVAFGVGLLELGVAQDSVLAALGLTLEELRAARPLGFESAAGIVVVSCLAQGAAALLVRAAQASLTARAKARAALARRLGARGLEELVPSAKLADGDRVVLAEGERAPADLRLDRAASFAPRGARGLLASAQKSAGDVIPAGSVLLSGEVTGRVTRGRFDAAAAMDSTVERTLAQIGAGRARQSASSWTAVAERAVLVAALGFAVFALGVHGWLEGTPLSLFAVLSAATVLVGFSTAAFSLGAPAAYAIAVMRARAAGVLIKDVEALERLAEVDVACLDKSGAVARTGRDGLIPGAASGEASDAPGAAASLRALRERGVGCRLLSDEPLAATKEDADRLGIPGSAGLTPAAKGFAVRGLQRRGARVLVVSGEAPDRAFAADADVAIAIAPGVAPDTVEAPIVVSVGHLDQLPALVDLSRALRRILRQNAAFAAVYNAVLLPAAVSGLLSPLQAASLLLVETTAILCNTARFLGAPAAPVRAEQRAPAPVVERRPHAPPAALELGWVGGASLVPRGAAAAPLENRPAT